MSLKTTFSDIASRIERWFASADQAGIVIAVVLVALVFLLRRPIAAMLIAALDALMKRLSVGIPDKARSQLSVTTSVLLVTLSIYFAIEALDFPDVPGSFFRRILASVAILAVFASWYNLCGPFVSLLSGGSHLDLQVETGWVERVARFGVVLFGITALLTVWEVDISGALTGVGVLGAGLAIATQDLIRNLVAGMNNVSERRFSVGDIIQIEGAFIGTVEQIDLRSTLLRGFDQIPRYVPNSELSNAVVLNYSQRHNRRVLHSFGFVLSLSSDQIESVCDALRDHLLTSGDFDVTEGAPKYVYVEGLSDDAIRIMFYAWTLTADYDEFLQVTHRLSKRVLELSKELDAPLAYPTQTLDLKIPPEFDKGAPE